MLDPADIIRDAIHSSLEKYPRDDDPDWSHHWITAEDSEHVTKTVLVHLKTNGFEIVRRSPD